MKKYELLLSVSRAKSFEQCPRKYYYHYVERLPRLQQDHFDLGVLIHGALEYFHYVFRKDGMELNLSRLMSAAFKKQYNKMIKEITVSAEVVKEAKELLAQYLRQIKKGIGSEIIQVEEEFELPLNKKYGIKGVIDRVDLEEDGTYHIKDYKTNKNKKYMEPFQLAAYGIYLFNRFPDIDTYKASYIMLRFDGAPISYTINKADVKKAKKKLIERGETITSEERWMKKPSILCKWCDFEQVCRPYDTW